MKIYMKEYDKYELKCNASKYPKLRDLLSSRNYHEEKLLIKRFIRSKIKDRHK